MRINQSKMTSLKKGFRALFWCYLGFYVPVILLGFGIGLSFTDIRVAIIISIGGLALPFVPLIWLRSSAKGSVKRYMYYFYCFLMIPVVPMVLLIGYMSFDDFKIGNGLRKVYEGSLDGNKHVAAFRTGDQGALGGDYLVAHLVTKVCCGIELRKYMGRIEYDKDPLGSVKYKGKTYRFPAYHVLKEKGNLQLNNR
jgi:hypothetical protein